MKVSLQTIHALLLVEIAVSLVSRENVTFILFVKNKFCLTFSNTLASQIQKKPKKCPVH